MSDPAVYLVGIGSSPWSWPRISLPSMKTKSAIHQLALSAGTKALLDAGVSYDHIDHAIGCGDLRGDNDVFYTFGKTGIPIHEVDNYSGLYAGIHFIQTGNAHCVLVICMDQSMAVGILLGSEAFLWRHPYLKDTAALVKGHALRTPRKGSATMNLAVNEALQKANIGPFDIQFVESNTRSALDDLDIPRSVQTWSANTSLLGLCEIIWLLRGWTHRDSTAETQNCLQCMTASNGSATAIILARADGKAAPAFKEVEHKKDSRERLGYNPALETRDIAMEDFESIKSRDEFSDEGVAGKAGFRRRGGDRAALAKM